MQRKNLYRILNKNSNAGLISFNFLWYFSIFSVNCLLRKLLNCFAGHIRIALSFDFITSPIYVLY